jgi:small subunit ribosomal protein S13
MYRISGVIIPGNKRIVIALQAIYGIGPTRALKLCQAIGVNVSTKASAVSDTDVTLLRNAIIDLGFSLEGELRRTVASHIKRLKDIGCYRGMRHKRGLPVRGQRTRTNARTRKGKKKMINQKKK